jgi:hypothetical protein
MADIAIKTEFIIENTGHRAVRAYLNECKFKKLKAKYEFRMVA